MHTLRDGNKTCKSINRPCDGVDRIILLTYRVNRHDLDKDTRTSANWPTELQIEWAKKSLAITIYRYALWQNMAEQASQHQVDLAPESSSATPKNCQKQTVHGLGLSINYLIFCQRAVYRYCNCERFFSSFDLEFCGPICALSCVCVCVCVSKSCLFTRYVSNVMRSTPSHGLLMLLHVLLPSLNVCICDSVF